MTPHRTDCKTQPLKPDLYFACMLFQGSFNKTLIPTVILIEKMFKETMF